MSGLHADTSGHVLPETAQNMILSPVPCRPPLVLTRGRGSAPAPVTIAVLGTGGEYSPPRASKVELRVRLTLDPAANTLAYEVAVAGVGAEDIYAVVLRHPDDEGDWLVARRLSGSGVSQRSGTLVLSAGLRARLDAGEVIIEVFTRDHPFGAARATVRSPG